MAWETTRVVHELCKELEDLAAQEGAPALRHIDQIFTGIRAVLCRTIAYGSAAAIDLCRIAQERYARLLWKKRP